MQELGVQDTCEYEIYVNNSRAVPENLILLDIFNRQNIQECTMHDKID